MAAIPTHLEKAVLRGWANFKTYSHAYGTFGRLVVPEQSTIIITKIIWHPFINGILSINGGLTYKDLLETFNEYQLKIDSDKGTMFYHFRNRVHWRVTDPTYVLDPTSAVTNDVLTKKMIFEPGDPMQIETYIVAKRDVKLTITRNAFNQFNTNFGVLEPVAAEKNPPDGVNGVAVSRQIRMRAIPPYTPTPTFDTMWYQPPSSKFTGLTMQPRDRNDYTVDYTPAPTNLLAFGSYLYSPFTSNNDLPKIAASITHPLITFECVTINNNNFDQLANI